MTFNTMSPWERNPRTLACHIYRIITSQALPSRALLRRTPSSTDQSFVRVSWMSVAQYSTNNTALYLGKYNWKILVHSSPDENNILPSPANSCNEMVTSPHLISPHKFWFCPGQSSLLPEFTTCQPAVTFSIDPWHSLGEHQTIYSKI